MADPSPASAGFHRSRCRTVASMHPDHPQGPRRGAESGCREGLRNGPPAGERRGQGQHRCAARLGRPGAQRSGSASAWGQRPAADQAVWGQLPAGSGGLPAGGPGSHQGGLCRAARPLPGAVRLSGAGRVGDAGAAAPALSARLLARSRRPPTCAALFDPAVQNACHAPPQTQARRALLLLPGGGLGARHSGRRAAGRPGAAGGGDARRRRAAPALQAERLAGHAAGLGRPGAAGGPHQGGRRVAGAGL